MTRRAISARPSQGDCCDDYDKECGALASAADSSPSTSTDEPSTDTSTDAPTDAAGGDGNVTGDAGMSAAADAADAADATDAAADAADYAAAAADYAATSEAADAADAAAAVTDTSPMLVDVGGETDTSPMLVDVGGGGVLPTAGFWQAVAGALGVDIAAGEPINHACRAIHRRERDTSACIRRHQDFALDPVRHPLQLYHCVFQYWGNLSFFCGITHIKRSGRSSIRNVTRYQS